VEIDMKASFKGKHSKTTVSMRAVELTAGDLGVCGPARLTSQVVGIEWQVVYTKPDGSEHVHLSYGSEAECDAAMDRVLECTIAYDEHMDEMAEYRSSLAI
jgi:hypothetical protein